MSSFIVHHYFESRKLRSFLVDVRSFMITDEQFTKAVPMFDFVHQKPREMVQPKIDNIYIVITPGFIGSTQTGITTANARRVGLVGGDHRRVTWSG